MNIEKQYHKDPYSSSNSQVRSMKRSSDKVKVFPTIPEQKIQKGFSDPSKVSALQNPTNDSSLNNEQGLVKCFNCLNNERKICQLTIQSGFEKKKNAKYLKIINAKSQKEKQLHKAYGQIVNQLRKKILEKKSEYANKFQSNNYLKQQQQIVKLKQENITLSQEIDSLKIQYVQLYNNPQKQQVQTKKQIQSTLFYPKKSLKKISNREFCYRNVEVTINNQIIPQKQTHVQSIESLISKEQRSQAEEKSSCVLINQQGKNQSGQNEIQRQELQIQDNQQLFHTIHEISEAGFQSCGSQAIQLAPEAKNENKFVLQNIKQSDLKYLLDSSEFYSVQDNIFSEISQVSQYNSEERLIRNSYQDLIDFLSPSSKVQKINTLVQTQDENVSHMINDLQQIISRKKNQVASITLLFQYFVRNFQIKLQNLSKKFNFAQELDKKLPKIQFNIKQPLQQNRIQQYITSLIQTVQKILRFQRKHYLKKLNDKHLTQSDFSSQIRWLEQEKVKLEKMITTHQLNKHILQSKIYDLQEESGSIIRNTAVVIRNKFIKDSYQIKGKSASEQQMAESIELPSTQDKIDNNLKEALDFIIQQLSAYFSRKDTNIQLDYTQDLKKQIKGLLSKLFSINQTNQELEKIKNQKVYQQITKKKQQIQMNNINLLSQIKQHKKKVIQKRQNSIVLSSHKSSGTVNDEQQIIALSSEPKNLQNSQVSFIQYSSKKIFSNLHLDKQQEIKQLKNLISEYEQQLKVLRADRKKKKVLYLNH